LEPEQQFEQEHSECVGDDLLDILEDRSTELQYPSFECTMEVAIVLAV